MVDKYLSRKAALNALGISHVTLANLVEAKRMEVFSTGGQKKYNVDKFLRDNKTEVIDTHQLEPENKKVAIEVKQIQPENKKINICYVRVSTHGQKEDLERQKKFMTDKYPTYELIEDIGSGINFNRKGLRKIIKLAIDGKIDKLVVAYKDRLTRFGFELIEDLIKEYSNGEIIIANEQDKKKEPREELVDDVMQILNVYTAKMNGLRKYGKLEK